MKQEQEHKSCKRQLSFSADVVDTFCFRWPAFRCYVLVRVLDNTIALLPIQSRRAFLYFHNAPLPGTPTPPCTPTSIKHREASRIHHMFHSWKDTLALSDKQDDSSSSSKSSNSSINNTSIHDEEHVERGRMTKNDQDEDPLPSSAVTLSDVLQDQPNLKEGWIHAKCQARADSQTSTALIIESPQNLLLLKARSNQERRMFLNLVKLQQLKHHYHHPSASYSTSSSQYPSTIPTARQLVNQYRTQSRHLYDMIRRLSHKVQEDQETIATYTEQLTTLDDAWDTLANAVKSVTSNYHQGEGSIQQFHLERTDRRLQKTMHGYTELAKRMHHLDEHIKANPDAVGTARVRLMLDNRNLYRRWCLRWLMLIVLILASIIGIAYYYYSSRS